MYSNNVPIYLNISLTRPPTQSSTEAPGIHLTCYLPPSSSWFDFILEPAQVQRIIHRSLHPDQITHDDDIIFPNIKHMEILLQQLSWSFRKKEFKLRLCGLFEDGVKLWQSVRSVAIVKHEHSNHRSSSRKSQHVILSAYCAHTTNDGILVGYCPLKSQVVFREVLTQTTLARWFGTLLSEPHVQDGNVYSLVIHTYSDIFIHIQIF